MATARQRPGCEGVGVIETTAYLHNPEKDASYAQWNLSHNAATIIEHPANEMIFDDFLGGDALRVFRVRFPPNDARMTNMVVSNPGAISLPSWVRVYTKEWYDGADVAEVAALAKEHDGVVLVSCGEHYWMGRQYHRASRRYLDYNEPLLKAGCYARRVAGTEPAQHEVVYNPKVAGRRIAKWNQLTVKPLVASYLLVSELFNVAHSLDKLCCDALNGVDLLGVNRWDSIMSTRRGVVNYCHRILCLFELLYGPRACWQVAEFQEFMLEWSTRGKRTWKAFDRYGNRTRLFTWFDKLLAQGKPRKRALKARVPKYMEEHYG